MFSKMQYDPILNWNCQNADPAPEEFKRRLPLRKKQRKPVAVQSLSMDDGLNKNPRNFLSLTQRLELQKSREAELDTENPKLITSLKYSIKQNYNRRKLPLFIEVVSSTTMETRVHNPTRSGYKERSQLLEIKEERGTRLHPEGRRNASLHPD